MKPPSTREEVLANAVLISQQVIAEEDADIKRLTQKIEEDAPKVAYVEKVVNKTKIY